MSDPRPRVDATADPVVVGSRCTACRHPVAFPRPVCPVCRGPVSEARFGPAGTVFASTVIRIPVGDRVPPYALAHVDLDDGPRILATTEHGPADVVAPPVGARVRLCGTSADGDPVVAVTG